jgi:hypothetical protein
LINVTPWLFYVCMIFLSWFYFKVGLCERDPTYAPSLEDFPKVQDKLEPHDPTDSSVGHVHRRCVKLFIFYIVIGIQQGV